MSEIPSTWETVRLLELAEVNPPKDRIDIAPASPMAFVPMAAVQEEFGGIDVSSSRPFEQVKKGYVQFHARDVLFAKITPCMENGKVGVVPELESDVGYGSTEFHIIRSPKGIEPRWIAHYLSRQEFRRLAQRNMSGSAGQLRVPEGWLVEQAIPVAPAKELSRIVDKLEELVSDLDAGVAALGRACAKLKRYRAAVLKAAVEGRLTEKWRAEHPDVEPASKLLERILGDRRKKWEAAQLKKFADKGQSPPEGWKDKYPEPVEPDEMGWPKLPAGWKWSSIGQCFRVAVGATPSRRESKYWSGDVNWVSSGEVRFTRITETRERITREGLENSSTQLNPKGSVLLGMIGEGKTRGQAAILDIEAANNQNCAAIWVSETAVLPEFVYFWLWSRYEITRAVGSGNNQPALNKSLVERMPLPLPPVREQAEIVLEAGRLLSICDAVETQLDHEGGRSTRLRQAILKRAFEGKLVPQDPDDEPASALLARIRAGKEAGKRLIGQDNGIRKIRKKIRTK